MRKQCFFDQCEANSDDSMAEPSEARFLNGVWVWFCMECAEQIDAEAEQVKVEDRYYDWNGGRCHLTGVKLDHVTYRDEY